VELGLLVAVASEVEPGVAENTLPVFVAGATGVILDGRSGVLEAVAEGVTVGG